MREEIGKQFGSWDNPTPRKMKFDKINVSGGSTYELNDETKFVNLLHNYARTNYMHYRITRTFAFSVEIYKKGILI